MKAIILYDAMSTGGSTDRIINTIGEELVKKGMYVEKAKVAPKADYDFLSEFELIILGSPIYNLTLGSNLSGAFLKSNLIPNLRGKKVAIFVICGSPEIAAEFFYLPQLKIPTLSNEVLAEKIFGMSKKDDPQTPIDFAEEIYRKAMA
ncbi:MAG: protochlorophyllide oxidoreductase [Chlorobiales bacterium]|jgi:hypothetical protein|nr:protochlorophyllide oxidoreductase [Chlorobiales bacterium]